MDDASRPIETKLSEDQRAVNSYFESAEYQEAIRGRRRSHRYSNAADSRADSRADSHRAITLLDLDPSPPISFLIGLAGLNVILLIFACVSPMLMHYTQDMFSPSNGFFVMLAFIQTIILPPIISFSFATVTPMFWYGSVLLRFAVGILMVVPGCVAFYWLINMLESGAPDDFWFSFSGVMFTQFLVAGTIALVIQMWSPWTLTHHRDDPQPLPPLGTRAMLELTGVAAIGCAMFMTEGLGEIVEGLLFFAGMGGLSSLAVIAVLIAFLRKDRRNLISALAAFAASFAMAALMCGFFAVQEFGWSSVSDNLLYFAATALYGAAVISGVMWICVCWLGLCGWSCVNRNLERTSRSQILTV